MVKVTDLNEDRRLELPDCMYICRGCLRLVCMDEEPSPTEYDGICAECFDLEDPEVSC